MDDGQDETNEDEEHEGDCNGEDDEGDLLCEVQDHAGRIPRGHRGDVQQQRDGPVAEGLCSSHGKIQPLDMQQQGDGPVAEGLCSSHGKIQLLDMQQQRDGPDAK